MRLDGSDLLFGGAGTDLVRNNMGDESADGHARDADVLAGDNANIIRIVGINGRPTNSFLNYGYDTYGTLKDHRAGRGSAGLHSRWTRPGTCQSHR